MPQIINTNIASLNAQRNLNKSQAANQTALQRLSSGLRINSAKDDAAGLAISTRFNSQIRGLNVAVRNAGDGISLAQTAEGALGTMNDNLQRIRELAVQSANATNSDVDRDALQSEVAQLLSEVSRTADETDFNGRKLLDGSFSATFQIGANAGQTLDISIAELTAEKLGSASTAGITANGNASALANGDLTINGVPIAASKAGDDSYSTSNAGASAIAKVEAINRHSEDTGVTASVNANVLSGAEMTGASTTGNLSLNGVAIAITSTTDTAGTRAAVAEAINAVSDQTGIKAVNSDADTGGVQLIAENGQNITLSFGGTLTAAATGLATANTYEGGYTLVADSDVGEMVITGGNGTGNGDLSNAGLVAGTYDRGVASTVNDVTSSTNTASNLSGDGGSLTNTLGDSADNATIIGAGSDLQNTIYPSAASAVGQTAASAITFTVNSALGLVGAVTLSAGGNLGSAIAALDTVAGINAFEQAKIVISDFTAITGGNTLYLAGQSIALPDITAAAYDTQIERLEYLTDAINNTDFGATISLTAELTFAQTGIVVVMNNFGVNSAGQMTLAVGSSVNGVGGAIAGYVVTGVNNAAGQTFAAAGVNMAVDPTDVAGEGSTILGALAFVATAGTPVTIQVQEGTAASVATNDFVSGGTREFTSNGSNNLASSSKNVVSVTVDGVAQTAITSDEDDTVNDLAAAINTNFSDVNAWEEVTITFDATNLAVGDTLYIGQGSVSGVSNSGVAVAITDADASGTVTISDLAANINLADFSGQNMDVSVELNAAGTEMTLTVRNFSGEEVRAETSAEGRALQEKTTNNLVGSTQQVFSGTLAYAATDSQDIALNISDSSSTGEFYTGASVNDTYDSVNGLEDGDMLINGVSIGAAETGDDKASAEFASDNTRILSSSKELSAISVAGAINKVSEETGVSAKINATEVVGGDGSAITGASPTTGEFAIGDAAEIFINGYSAGTVTLQDDGSGAIDTDRAKSDALALVNGIAGQTGVVATDNGVSLTMTAEDGRNVSIAIDDQSGANASIGAMFGLDATGAGIGETTFGSNPATSNNGISAESATYETTYGTITLESAGEFTLTAGAQGADELAALGLNEGSYGGAVDGQFLTDIDISTFEGATEALTAIDNAIGAIASQRAVLGAIQNRMESTVSNLAITAENLSAANSRIQDADFAAETAELSRTQVLQQAGISILAQANQGPQQVLSLLG